VRHISPNVAEKIKTHIIFNNVPPPANITLYVIMWKNMVEPDRPRMTNAAHAHCMLDN